MLTVSNSDFLQRMKAAGQAFTSQQPEQNDSKVYRPDLELMRDIAQKYGGYKPDKPKWGDWPDEKKMAYCSRLTGQNRYVKEIGGDIKPFPMNCNICELCQKANAEALGFKIRDMDNAIDPEVLPGQWRKKRVDDNLESKALKKRVNRNLDGRYFEASCPASSRHNDVYTYVPSGTKDPDSYGDPIEIDDIDYEAIYKANRETGKKLSKGKAFKMSKKPAAGKDMIKVETYSIILEGQTRKREAQEIMYRTNYLEKAETVDDVKRLYAYQLKFIIRELEQAGIKIAAVKRDFFYKAQEEMLREWNSNVQNWINNLSTKASYMETKDTKVDTLTQHLHGPLADPVVYQ